MLPLFGVSKYLTWHHSCSVALVHDLADVTALPHNHALLVDNQVKGCTEQAETPIYKRCTARHGPHVHPTTLPYVIMEKSGTVYGRVFFLISLGGQAPHVPRAHMWALNTCGEPNEIELAIRVLTDGSTFHSTFHSRAHGWLYLSFVERRPSRRPR